MAAGGWRKAEPIKRDAETGEPEMSVGGIWPNVWKANALGFATLECDSPVSEDEGGNEQQSSLLDSAADHIHRERQIDPSYGTHSEEEKPVRCTRYGLRQLLRDFRVLENLDPRSDPPTEKILTPFSHSKRKGATRGATMSIELYKLAFFYARMETPKTATDHYIQLYYDCRVTGFSEEETAEYMDVDRRTLRKRWNNWLKDLNEEWATHPKAALVTALTEWAAFQNKTYTQSMYDSEMRAEMELAEERALDRQQKTRVELTVGAWNGTAFLAHPHEPVTFIGSAELDALNMQWEPMRFTSKQAIEGIDVEQGSDEVEAAQVFHRRIVHKIRS